MEYIVALELAGSPLGVLESNFDLVQPARLLEENRKPTNAERHVVETSSAPLEKTPELIERLARQLSLASGEDPDEHSFPLRFPRWRYHCARAKALLSITAAEHQALDAVVRQSSGGSREDRVDLSVLQ